MGLSTRALGIVAMVHSDDLGLILPPKIAPIHVALLPFEEDTFKNVMLKISKSLNISKIKNKLYEAQGRHLGWRIKESQIQGIPLICIYGPEEHANGTVSVISRHNNKKASVKLDDLKKYIKDELKNMSKEMYAKALSYKENIERPQTVGEFVALSQEREVLPMLFYWCGYDGCEADILNRVERRGIVPRLIVSTNSEEGRCINCGRKCNIKVLYGKSY